MSRNTVEITKIIGRDGKAVPFKDEELRKNIDDLTATAEEAIAGLNAAIETAEGYASNAADSATESAEQALAAGGSASAAAESATAAAGSAAAAAADKAVFADIVAEQVAAMQVREGQTVIDSTLTVAGAAADAKATGDAVAELKNDLSEEVIEKTDNLFFYPNNPDATIKTYYKSDGTMGTSDSWTTCIFRIAGYDTVEYSGLSSAGGDAVVSVWFDENDICIGHFKQAVGTNRIDIPENAAILGFSINRSETVYRQFTLVAIKRGAVYTALDSLNTDISALDDRVDALENSGTVPSYFMEQLESKTSAVIDNMNAAGANGETFVFITDPHWETNYKNSPALAKYILERTKVSQVFCGGDLINEGEKATMYGVMIDFIRAFQFGFSGYFLPIARGNHDDNSNWASAADVTAHEFDYSTVFALMYKDIADKVTFLRPGVEFSFYFDRVPSKTRYIFIDTQRNGRTIPTTALISLLNDTPQDYKVVFIAHFIYTSSGFTSGANLLFNMIKAFNSKTTGSYAGANFDFTASLGKVVCVIAGHTHADYQWAKDDAANIAGVPIIITDTDSTRNSAAIEGTTDSQCFDVITLDYNANTIKCVRIGRGSDRTFSFD